MTLQVGGSSATRSVSGKFSDPDGDTLTYSVNSPSPTIAKTSISGSTVKIAPVALGTTGKIIVTATDPDGETATQDFTATVENPPPPPNRAPTAVGSISNVTLQVGGSSATRSVSGKFSDPDNDTLTYSVNSPSPTIAKTSISGSTVKIAPVALGTTGKIIVTATDPDGETATQDFTATVENPPPPPPPPNSAPVTSGSLSNRTVDVGASAFSVSVSGKFSDPDGDNLTFSASSSETSVATVSVSSGTLTVTPKTGGTTTIKVTAKDPGGLKASLSFTVKVNRKPTTTGSLMNRTVNVGASAFDVTVSDKFSDPDGDNLTFSASSSETSAATVSVSSGTLTVTPKTGGTTTITATASDSRLTVSLSFTVKVNRKPTTTGSLMNRTVNVGASAFDVTVSGKFSDPDGDNLTFSASSSETSVATVSESDGTLTVTPETEGATTITVTAADPGGLSVSLTFTVTVTGTDTENQPPTVSWAIPDQPLERDGSSRTVILSSKFSDPDDDILSYSASSSDTTVATVSVSGSIMTITPGVNGTSTVTVIATDPGGLTASQTSTATVSRAPVTSGTIPKLTLEESDQSRSIDVASYFSDPDGEALIYEAVSSNSAIAKATTAGSTVTVTRVAPGTGLVWVTATDPGGLTVLQSMTIRVTNRPPVTETSIADQTLYLTDDFRRIDLADKFSDPDGQVLAFTATSSNTGIATVAGGGSTLQIRPVARGSTTVTVRATDPGNRYVEQTFIATVANQSPQTIEPSIGDQTLYMLGGPQKINAALYFSDPDGDRLSYTVYSPSPATVNVSISGGTITLTPVALGNTGKILVTARDPGGLTADQDFTVTVVAGSPPTPTNRVPVAKGNITVNSLYQLGSSVVIDVTPYFSDPDSTDVLAYTVTSQDSGIVIVSISGSSVKITPKGPGTTGKITVTARDPGGLTADQEFDVTVIAGAPPVPPNRYPVAVGTITVDTLYVEGTSITIDVTSYFSDPDDDILDYSVNSPAPEIVEVSRMGSNITLRPVSAGMTGKIMVTARDPGGLSATQDFNVTVVAGAPPTPTNSAPEIREVLETWRVTIGGGKVALNVAPYFQDPDGDSLSYQLDPQGAGRATLTIADSTLSIEPLALGTTGKNQLRAVDPAGLYAEQVFVVFVVTNLAPDTLMTIPDQMLTVAKGPVELDLSTFFFDPDQDTLTYTAESSNTGAATVSVTGDTLTITPVEKDMSTDVTVTASDGDLSVAQVFEVTVDNSAPAAADTIQDQTMTVAGGNESLDLSDYFSDVDGDDLSYTAESSNTGAATVSVTGDTLTITPVEKDMSTDVTVTASDGDLSLAQVFEVTVDNSAPAAADTIQDQTMTVAGGNESLDLSDYFSDVDGDDLSYTAESSNTGAATVSVTGDTLTITPVEKDMSTDVTVTASDGDLSLAQVFEVTVDNSAPAAADTIQDQTMTVAGGNESLDLSDYFSDVDGDDLSYTAESSNTGAATVSVTGDTLTITPVEKDMSTDVTVTASDGDLSLAQVFEVTVDNSAPAAADTIQDQTMTVAGGNESLDLSDYFSDVDGDDLSYTAESSNTGAATVSVTGDTLTITPVEKDMSTDVTVTASDGDLSLAQVFEVTVDNSAPAAADTIQDQTMTVAGGNESLDLSDYFSDVDGDDLSYTAVSSDTNAVTVSVSDASLSITPRAVGKSTVGVTATDNDGASATQSFTVTVTPEPTCPALVGSIADQTLTVGGDAVRINLTQYFSLPAIFDPDYVVNSTDATVTTTSLASDILTVTPGAAGTDSVSVTVSKQDCDPVTHSFVVTVILSCPAAITDAPIQDQTLFAGAGITLIDLTEHFEHIDKDDLEITVTSPSPEIAVLSIEGSVLKIDPKSAGQIDTVTVTVTDTAENDACDPASLSFMITVMDSGIYPWKVAGENVYRLVGNVGIGVENPDQKLVVDGKIEAEEYHLAMVPADYVFKVDYDLMSLEEAERYIRGHDHLPGIASGTEMKANGIGISRIQTKLLEKIEELSLYVIGQHEQLRAQGHSIDSQRRRLKLQHQIIRQLDHRLERLEQ